MVQMPGRNGGEGIESRLAQNIMCMHKIEMKNFDHKKIEFQNKLSLFPLTLELFLLLLLLLLFFFSFLFSLQE